MIEFKELEKKMSHFNGNVAIAPGDEHQLIGELWACLRTMADGYLQLCNVIEEAQQKATNEGLHVGMGKAPDTVGPGPIWRRTLQLAASGKRLLQGGEPG